MCQKPKNFLKVYILSNKIASVYNRNAKINYCDYKGIGIILRHNMDLTQ